MDMMHKRGILWYVRKGIIDPVKVVRTALQDAASISGLLVTTEAMIADKPEKTAPLECLEYGWHGVMGGWVDRINPY